VADALTRSIAAYAAGVRFADLPANVVRAANERLVDALACAIAAYGCEAAQIGRRLGRGALPECYPGRVLGYGERTTAEMAAFTNTCMIRALDFNDQYPGGHPSDCLGALFALAEENGLDGRRLLASMTVAYEIFVRFNDATKLREQGWDQGFVAGIATAAAVSNLLGLSAEQIAEAVAIVTVANVPMRNTRAGELSIWKGVATAFAVRNGVFAALLAAEGMTGPDQPFQGRHGLWDLITGPFELATFPNQGGSYRIQAVNLKYWPVEYNAQVVVWLGLEIREAMDLSQIERIDVGVDSFALSEIGGDPEKWDPKTRETADHSLPFILARTLVDGSVSATTFEPAAVADPALRPLMAKIAVHRDAAVDALAPPTSAITADVTTTDGARHRFELRDPLGHANNPIQAKDVQAKFLRVAEPAFGPQRAKEALERWWNLPNATNLPAALALLDM
jgi:2-methylcitrate dehydratase